MDLLFKRQNFLRSFYGFPLSSGERKLLTWSLTLCIGWPCYPLSLLSLSTPPGSSYTGFSFCLSLLIFASKLPSLLPLLFRIFLA
jgi:hypothetical protein